MITQPGTLQRKRSPSPPARRPLQRAPDAPSARSKPPGSCACGGGCPRCQAKSAMPGVSQPGDAVERQADRMAERALQGSDHGASHAHESVINDGASASALSGRLSGHGASLDNVTRGFFESRFNTSLANVRVHTGAAAASLAHSYEARAFTFGRDIVFNAGEYSPHTAAGKRLLAHELAHVQQQRHMPAVARQVMRSPYPGCDKKTTGVDDADGLIDDARKQAKRMIAKARKGFPRLSGSSLNNMHRHFHCPSNDQMRAVMDNLEAIEKILPSVTAECVGSKTALCKSDPNLLGEAKSGVASLCPAAFGSAARAYKLAASFLHAAALNAGFTNFCSIRDACYDDFTVPADDMLGNSYSYTWFIVAQAGFSVPAPATIPCSPSDTGENVVVPPSAIADPSKIRPLTGFDEHPKGSIVQQVFSDRSGNRFIYHDTMAGAKAYTTDGRKRVYLP